MQMRNLIILLSLFLVACNPKGAIQKTDNYQEPKGLVLENENLKAIFDSENGALLSFTSKQTGWHIQRRPELALSFELLVPAPEKRNNPVLGNRQKLESAVVSADKKSITFTWKNLQSERAGVLDITLVGTVKIDTTGLTFNMDVDNKSPFVIEAVAWPAIGDVTPAEKGKKLSLVQNAYDNVTTDEIYTYFWNQVGYWGVDFPTKIHGTTESLHTLLAQDEQGLYMGVHDYSCKERVEIAFQLKPGAALGDGWGGLYPDSIEGGKVTRVEMKLWHMSFVNPGEKYSLSPIVFNPYQGSLHKGWDEYKKWFATWHKAPRIPAWANDVHSWMQLQLNSPEEDYRIPYTKIVDYARECAKNGVKAIQLTGWSIGGQDRSYPSHSIEPHLGTWQELKDAIAECEKMGIHVILFCKFTWVDESTKWYKDELYRYTIKDPYGNHFPAKGYNYQTITQLTGLNTRRLIPMCQMAPAWRKIADKEFQKLLDLGASGMMYDECQHHYDANYCWDKSHGHHIPACVFGGDVPLAEGFRKLADAKNPDFLITGEAVNDFQKNIYSLSYSRQGIWSTPIQKYINPYGLQMIAVMNFDGRPQINICLRSNYIICYEPYFFKGRLGDFPKTLAYGNKVDSLRRTYSDYLWHGEFRDTLGASVTKGNERYGLYSVFINHRNNKRAVVVVNGDFKNDIEVAVDLPESKNLVIVTPENQKEQIYKGKRLKIPANSAVVLIEK
jgi:hypothetical protein